MMVLQPTFLMAEVHGGLVVLDQPLPPSAEGRRAVLFIIDDSLPEPTLDQRRWSRRRSAWPYTASRGTVKKIP